MIVLLLIVVVAIAAIAGYLIGARRSAAAANAAPSAAAPGAAPVDASRPAQVAGEAIDRDGIGREKARIIRSRDGEAEALRSQLADRDAAVFWLQQLSRERESLLRQLAEEKGAIARYRQVVTDIESNAPPRILAGVGEPDDLKLIVGVGPVLERLLHSLGVATFRQIAHWTERDVAEFDTKLAEFPGRIVRDQWVTQARALHQSKYGDPA